MHRSGNASAEYWHHHETPPELAPAAEAWVKLLTRQFRFIHQIARILHPRARLGLKLFAAGW
jgi:hypothetical protein